MNEVRELIAIPAGDQRVVRAYLAIPAGRTGLASMVVIHQNRGLTEWIRSVSDRLAGSGFAAICPDLLSGMGPGGGGTESFASSDDARSALRDLDAGQVASDLQAAFQYVRGLPETGDTVAVAGFCWGGAQAFRLATLERALTAAFVFYGRPPEREAMTNIVCPVYGFYGETDARINATLDETIASMAAAGKTFEPVIYTGVGHAFLHRGDRDDASEDEKSATRDAWARFLQLLNRL